MDTVIRKELLPGAMLTSVQTKKFKTGLLSVNLLLPLTAKDAAKNALLPAVLRRGTARYPDMERFSAALDELYGMRLEPMVRKKGEVQCVGFVASFVDGAYVPGGQRLLEDAAALLGDTLLDPATRSGRFYAEYVEGERDNLADKIRSQLNDKRVYADKRLIQLMCQGEAYGVDALGDEKSVAAISTTKLFSYYRDLLGQAEVEFFYCGSAPRERVEQALRAAFGTLPRQRDFSARIRPLWEAPQAKSEEVRYFTEELDVAQGKLAMGFRTGATVSNGEYPAFLLMNAVFGSGTTSKLFLNVREKLSLCYYASSAYRKLKGYLTVSSGIEVGDYEKAYNEILAQLDAVRQGQVEDWELETARRTLVNALRSAEDSQGRLEDFWLTQAIGGLDYGPSDLALLLEEVDLDRVVKAAGQVELDSVYFLKGTEGA